MKAMIALILSVYTFNIFASSYYDNELTKCKKKDITVTIRGATSFFSGRSIAIVKSAITIVDESYKERLYKYDDRLGTYSPRMPEQLDDILSFASKVKPKSVRRGFDYYFRESENTIVYSSFHGVSPAYGGETQALFVQLINSKDIYMFDLATECTIQEL